MTPLGATGIPVTTFVVPLMPANARQGCFCAPIAKRRRENRNALGGRVSTAPPDGLFGLGPCPPRAHPLPLLLTSIWSYPFLLCVRMAYLVCAYGVPDVRPRAFLSCRLDVFLCNICPSHKHSSIRGTIINHRPPNLNALPQLPSLQPPLRHCVITTPPPPRFAGKALHKGRQNTGRRAGCLGPLRESESEPARFSSFPARPFVL